MITKSVNFITDLLYYTFLTNKAINGSCEIIYVRELKDCLYLHTL